MLDPCVVNNGGCGVHSTCMSNATFTSNCTCDEGYVSQFANETNCYRPDLCDMKGGFVPMAALVMCGSVRRGAVQRHGQRRRVRLLLPAEQVPDHIPRRLRVQPCAQPIMCATCHPCRLHHVHCAGH